MENEMKAIHNSLKLNLAKSAKKVLQFEHHSCSRVLSKRIQKCKTATVGWM